MSDDHVAIQNLVARYALLVDTGDFAGVGDLLADATFIGANGDFTGRAEIAAMLDDTVIRYEDGTPRTQHATSNLAVEVGGDTAIARSYVTIFQALPDFPLQCIAAGRYRDTFARRNGDWRFVERRVTIHLVGDVSRHLKTALAGSGSGSSGTGPTVSP
ncbi:nuclear transport factor 2 family protein [Kutzneria kofuensis]|uniref:Ketosteroid isomerase-like protein n=1 Tax=Kutzneria kofuensis TaxID=103725 RepID=A0A7W9KC74_9PSEU|nr:nuclear transport factor 2 family protein [Kutzneria kofuensis]MBB5889765.1 ketosteroid isomerase-like protein [Kutzneria kofuensis]